MREVTKKNSQKKELLLLVKSVNTKTNKILIRCYYLQAKRWLNFQNVRPASILRSFYGSKQSIIIISIMYQIQRLTGIEPTTNRFNDECCTTVLQKLPNQIIGDSKGIIFKSCKTWNIASLKFLLLEMFCFETKFLERERKKCPVEN